MQICLGGRPIKRLRGEPHLITHDVGWGAIDPRDLDADTLPGLVRAPHEGGQPADARFHHDNLKFGKLAEHAFEDEAQQLCLMRLCLGDVVLQPIGRPTDRAWSHAILAPRMDGYGQPVLLRGSVDGPIVAAAEEGFALHQHQHGHETLVLGAPLDLIDGEVRGLHRHDDRGPETGIARQPLGREPVVDGAAKGCRHVGVENRLRAVEHIANGMRRAEGVERLCAQQLKIAAGLAVLGSPIRST